MTYTKNFTYTTTGSVEVKNISMSCDKRNGNVVVEFDARGKDWVPGSPYPQAKIKYGGAVKSTLDLTNLSNSLKRYRVIWFAGEELALINHGSQSVVLEVDDEDDTTQTFTQSVTIDLDPVEFHFTDTTDIDFSDDNTPRLTFRLTELHNANTKLTPTISINGATPTLFQNMNVYFESGGYMVTDTSIGVAVIHGKKFSEIDGLIMDSTDAGYVTFKEISYYSTVLNTSLSEGYNSIKIDLACTVIS